MKFVCLGLLALMSYLLGGINPSIILSRLVYHEDIREKGSGNPGFTNFKRVYGWRWGWLALVGDIGKTILPVWASCLLMRHFYDLWTLTAALCGLCVMLGHAFPVWYRFRGGKAFIACATTVWFVDWRVGLVYLGVFFLLLFTLRYMSFSSMCAGASYPVSVLVCFPGSWILFALALLSAVLLIARHHANIRRLVHGEESKFYLFKKEA